MGHRCGHGEGTREGEGDRETGSGSRGGDLDVSPGTAMGNSLLVHRPSRGEGMVML